MRNVTIVKQTQFFMINMWKLNRENWTEKTEQRKLNRENWTEKTEQKKLNRENWTLKPELTVIALSISKLENNLKILILFRFKPELLG